MWTEVYPCPSSSVDEEPQIASFNKRLGSCDDPRQFWRYPSPWGQQDIPQGNKQERLYTVPGKESVSCMEPPLGSNRAPCRVTTAHTLLWHGPGQACQVSLAGGGGRRLSLDHAGNTALPPPTAPRAPATTWGCSSPAEKTRDHASPAGRTRGRPSPAGRTRDHASPAQRTQGRPSPAQRTRGCPSPAGRTQDRSSPAGREWLRSSCWTTATCWAWSRSCHLLSHWVSW